MAHGSRLLAHASGSWLKAHGQEQFGARARDWGTQRQIFLGHGPWATSLKAWAMILEPWTINLPGFGQGRVRSPVMWTLPLYICSSFVLEHLQLKRTKRNDSSNFFAKEQWKRTRTTFRARTAVSCLRSAHARRPLWEPLEVVIVRSFHVWGSIF